jgi:hypothetical protein
MITEENPVPVESAGKMKEIARAWIGWGRARQIVRMPLHPDLCEDLRGGGIGLRGRRSGNAPSGLPHRFIGLVPACELR